MEPRSVISSTARPSLELRPLRFEEVAEVLRLIRRAVETGCRGAYDADQRQAVWTGYAQTMFAEALGPFQTIVAEVSGRLAGVAQWDAADERLRALFVDGELQGQGIGSALLAEVERGARLRGCVRLRGAMSLNARDFYLREGYRAYSGPEPLRTARTDVPIVRMEKLL